jgi:Raf kinase inhibitor-like YbhB/YbcL family protein
MRAARRALPLAALAACRAPRGDDWPTAPPDAPAPLDGPHAPPSFALRSPAFTEEGSLPADYTCDGRGASPPLRWEAPPRFTRSFVLLVEDPDAARGTFVHWLRWGIPEDARELPAGAPPARAHDGRNGFGALGWGAPCPPPGRAHRYRFRLFALDLPPDRVTLPPTAGRLELALAMHGHVLAEAVLTGRYARAPR